MESAKPSKRPSANYDRTRTKIAAIGHDLNEIAESASLNNLPRQRENHRPTQKFILVEQIYEKGGAVEKRWGQGSRPLSTLASQPRCNDV